MNLRARFGGAGSPLASLGALGVAMISVQFGASYATRLFPVVGAEGAAALRVSLAALMLTAILRPWRKPISRKAWPAIAGYGVSLGIMNLLFYLAIQRAPLGLVVAIEFTGPLLVSIASSRRWVDFLWIALAVVGLALLLPLGSSIHAAQPLGLLFALGAGLFWGLYILFGQKAALASGAQAAAVGSIISAIVLFPIGFHHAGLALFSPSIFVSAFVVALASSALPYTLEMFALTQLPTRVFSSLMCADPAIGALMGWSMLHQVLEPKSILAVVLIMVASLCTTLTIETPNAQTAD